MGITVIATDIAGKRKSEAEHRRRVNHRDTEYTEKKTQRRIPMGSSAPPGTRTSSAMVSKRNGLQEPVLVTRLSLSSITLRVQPGSGVYRLEWTLSASDWFAQAGEARVLKACTSMGRLASREMDRPSSEPTKWVGERRERPWVALCVPLCPLCLCGESALRLGRQLESEARASVPAPQG